MPARRTGAVIAPPEAADAERVVEAAGAASKRLNACQAALVTRRAELDLAGNDTTRPDTSARDAARAASRSAQEAFVVSMDCIDATAVLTTSSAGAPCARRVFGHRQE